MNWVILAHAYGISYPAVRNPLEISKIIDSWIFKSLLEAVILSIPFSYSVAYLYFKQAEKTDGKIPWLYFYIHRYIRLTPIGLVVEHTLHQQFQPNAVQCFGWPWYLANDMQFYVISPLFLITLWRWPKIGYSLLGLFFCTTFVANFVIIYVYDFNLDMGTILKQDGHIEDFWLGKTLWNDHMNKVYVKPYTRIGPYLVGLALGYYLHKRKQNKSGKLKLEWLLAGWLVALGLICACIFSLYHQDLSLLFACFFNALNRTVFAIGLAWILFVCIIGQGGFVDRLLSWKFWFPLSRLTFEPTFCIRSLRWYTLLQ
ncbi:nose resistant to fluoxetine protein 6 [Caerostris extrusa]|uniref:Nose resistant to fluoxetine protein 6 n=1 Tax=Caerostris extrusa TaxID=172846 RepID=A0AAV4SU35_CAEEX|nr:nose resistant to fluoxetine protein 6 [Caerostris extrusa]